MDNEVHRLIAELAEVVGTAGSGPDGLKQAAGVVAHDDKLLASFLESVIADRSLAAEIAAASYWHAHGFAKLVLHRHDDPGFYLRLHVWPDGSPDRSMFETSQVHDHRWAFASVVLAGGVHVEYFEECSGFDLDDEKILLCQRYRYAMAAGAPFGRLHPEGTVALLSVGGSTYGPPERHYGDDHALHHVTPFVGEFTATFFVQGPVLKDAATVYQPLGREPLVQTGTHLTTDDVVDLAAATLAHMTLPD